MICAAMWLSTVADPKELAGGGIDGEDISAGADRAVAELVAEKADGTLSMAGLTREMALVTRRCNPTSCGSRSGHPVVRFKA